MERLLLQHAQQLHLRLRLQIPDLVEEQRPFVRLLEAANAALVRAGEGTTLVAEQFAFEQILRDRAAIDRDERRLGARAMLVNRARDQFLARAGLTANQHCYRLRRHAANLLAHFLHPAAHADQRRVAATGRIGERDRLAHDPTRCNGLVQHRKQLGDFEGFLQVVVRAAFRCLNRGFNRPMGGH